MKIIIIVIIFSLLLSSYPISAQVNNSLIDDLFNSLPTRVYYWRIEETGYEYAISTNFNAVVLKRSGLTDKFLFQESDLVVIEEVGEIGFERIFFYHYYYFPDENEQDMKVEIFLPNSESTNYTDTQYPRIANAKELDDIALRIDQFSNALYEYNTLYLEELKYDPGINIFVTSFGLAMAALSFWGLATAEDDLSRIGYGGLGVLCGIAGITRGVITISDAIEVEPRRAELKKLESTLKDIINSN